jgi:hypothetical protein
MRNMSYTVQSETILSWAVTSCSVNPTQPCSHRGEVIDRSQYCMIMMPIPSCRNGKADHKYLLESNLPHTAFTLLSESSLPSTSLFQHFNPSYPTPSSASSSRAKPTSNSSTTNAAGLATPGAAGANGVGANGILGNAAASNASVNGQNAQNGAGGNAAGAPRTGPGSHAFGSAEGRIQRGELIRKLWKGLRWEEVERHVSASGVSSSRTVTMS